MELDWAFTVRLGADVSSRDGKRIHRGVLPVGRGSASL